MQGVDSDALESVIRFFYTGECAIAVSTAVPLLDAAIKLEVCERGGRVGGREEESAREGTRRKVACAGRPMAGTEFGAAPCSFLASSCREPSSHLPPPLQGVFSRLPVRPTAGPRPLICLRAVCEPADPPAHRHHLHGAIVGAQARRRDRDPDLLHLQPLRRGHAVPHFSEVGRRL